VLYIIIRIIKLRRMRWTEHVGRKGEKRDSYTLLIGKAEVRRRLGGLRRKWVGNTRMDLGEIGWDVVDSIGLDQDSEKWRAL
jgi:hypothetical protein